MPNQDQTNTPPITDTNPVLSAPAADAASEVKDTTVSEEPANTEPLTVKNSEMVSDIASRIADAHNILIALSSDPSVDELAAAIGMSLCLDRVGKRATAIFSGNIPNALEFLKPEDTFETTADTLQDFVVAINKDKADHLRYKLDGDYVRIFITPYKTRIAEEDLEFSYGDFNIDLVIALDVANGVDLDSALREHGRIMHDATIINITTGNPGKLGEIEWSDKNSSSVSEMIARLLYSMSRKITIGPDDATAFLTGIVAATNHFSNGETTPGALEVASALLKSGANQLLISENISNDFDNNFVSSPKLSNFSLAEDKQPSSDLASLDIDHGTEDAETTTPIEPTEPATIPAAPAMPEELQAVADSLASSYIGPSAPVEQPATPTVITSEQAPAAAQFNIPVAGEAEKPEKVVAPSADFLTEPAEQGNKYGQMLEDALSEFVPPAPAAPEANNIPDLDFSMPAPDAASSDTDNILPPAPTPNFGSDAGMMPPMPPATPKIP
ncbi:hypothetical protein IJI00_01530 [Candidatus Saccharibacteria bacterium]|nr:hypothetical protein [Candidatus Saccharibacteria bacterium]